MAIKIYLNTWQKLPKLVTLFSAPVYFPYKNFKSNEMCRGLDIIIYFLSSQHYNCVYNKRNVDAIKITICINLNNWMTRNLLIQWFLHNISYCMWVALDSGGGFRLVPSSWSIDWNNQCLYWKVNIMIIFGIRNSVHVLPEAFQIQCFIVLFPQTMCGCVEARRLWLEVCDAEQFPISIASSDWSSLLPGPGSASGAWSNWLETYR